MDSRHLIAYGLIVLLVAAAFALAVYLRHHGRERTLHRNKVRDRARRKARTDSRPR